jgi:hypothetical protein
VVAPLSLAAPHGLARAVVSGRCHCSDSTTTGYRKTYHRETGSPRLHTRRQGGSSPQQMPPPALESSRRRACGREPTSGAPPCPGSRTGRARRSRARFATGDARATAAAQGASIRTGRARGSARSECERVLEFGSASHVTPCADRAGLARCVAQSSPQRATPPSQRRHLAISRKCGAHAWPTQQNAAGLAAVGPIA